jgi:hypothetical protein
MSHNPTSGIEVELLEGLPLKREFTRHFNETERKAFEELYQKHGLTDPIVYRFVKIAEYGDLSPVVALIGMVSLLCDQNAELKALAMNALWTQKTVYLTETGNQNEHNRHSTG